MHQLDITTIDLIIIGLYFTVIFAKGFQIARRTYDANDLFLAGRRLGWQPRSWWSSPSF